MGVGASALAAAPAVSATSPDRLEEVLSQEAVRRIRDELGDPEITGATRREVRYEERNFRSVPDITITSLETDIGTLVHGQYGSDSTVVQFYLDAGPNRAPAGDVIPERYGGIPEDGQGVLLLDGDNQMDEIGFLRSVTPSESEAVTSDIDAARTGAKVLYNSSLGQAGAYEVHVEAEPATSTASADGRETYVVEPASGGPGVDGGMEIADVSTFDDGAVSPMMNDCETWVAACLSSITATSTCAMACLSVGVGNIPGALICITCWVGSHASVPLSCGKALDEC